MNRVSRGRVAYPPLRQDRFIPHDAFSRIRRENLAIFGDFCNPCNEY
jgi:hypothetical protein